MDFWIKRKKNESNTTFFMIWMVDDYNWLDNFDTFLDILEHNCGCKVIEDEYVVYIRRAILEKCGQRFDFYHDSLDGAYICTQDEEAIPILEAVANDVIAELKKRAGIGCA